MVTGNAYEHYVDKKIHGRAGTESAADVGEVTNVHACTMAGCSGVRLSTKWPDGGRTFPCSKGVKARPDGSLEIM